jgi:hypothetical protein
MQRRQREPRSVGGEGAVWRQAELVGILEVLNVGQTVISSRSKKGNTQIDMTRIMPAEAALDVVAILPLEAKVFVSPNAKFSAMMIFG